jgi:thiamine thiazole synthase
MMRGLSVLPELSEVAISRAILGSYSDKLIRSVESDVVIVGAGPSGLSAASHLAAEGLKVVIVEKRLAPGGGIWGGAMGMNEVVVQHEAPPVVEAARVRYCQRTEGLYTIDAAELACALCLQAIRAGATLLNLVMLEDLCVREGRVTGVVANRTMISEELPIDPIVLESRFVIDASGHEAVAVERLRRRGLVPSPPRTGEGAMNAALGEAFVVERVGEVFPGLWVTGMAVCAFFGGPRMGPIFGGMLLSGKKVAALILAQRFVSPPEAAISCIGKSEFSAG